MSVLSGVIMPIVARRVTNSPWHLTIIQPLISCPELRVCSNQSINMCNTGTAAGLLPVGNSLYRSKSRFKLTSWEPLLQNEFQSILWNLNHLPASFIRLIVQFLQCLSFTFPALGVWGHACGGQKFALTDPGPFNQLYCIYLTIECG